MDGLQAYLLIMVFVIIAVAVIMYALTSTLDGDNGCYVMLAGVTIIVISFAVIVVVLLMEINGVDVGFFGA